MLVLNHSSVETECRGKQKKTWHPHSPNLREQLRWLKSQLTHLKHTKTFSSTKGSGGWTIKSWGKKIPPNANLKKTGLKLSSDKVDVKDRKPKKQRCYMKIQKRYDHLKPICASGRSSKNWHDYKIWQTHNTVENVHTPLRNWSRG